MKKLGKIVSVTLLLYVLVSSALFLAMLETPDDFAGTMRRVPWPALAALPFRPLWNVARGGQVRVGSQAPDFVLESPDHKKHFQLSSLRGQKPVVLVFGSYT